MINILYICIMIFILGVGYLYISSVHKINKADMAAKDAGSDIDTCLWDMNHNVGVVLKALQEKGIEPELPEDKSGLLALGMNPTLGNAVSGNESYTSAAGCKECRRQNEDHKICCG